MLDGPAPTRQLQSPFSHVPGVDKESTAVDVTPPVRAERVEKTDPSATPRARPDKTEPPSPPVVVDVDEAPEPALDMDATAEISPAMLKAQMADWAPPAPPAPPAVATPTFEFADSAAVAPAPAIELDLPKVPSFDVVDAAANFAPSVDLIAAAPIVVPAVDLLALLVPAAPPIDLGDANATITVPPPNGLRAAAIDLGESAAPPPALLDFVPGPPAAPPSFDVNSAFDEVAREPATVSDIDDGIDISDIDDEIELDKIPPPSAPVGPAHFLDVVAPPPPAVAAPVPTSAPLPFDDGVEVDVPVDWLVGAATDRFNLADILASQADAMILGDASDIVGSITTSADPMSVDPMSMDINDLLSPASAGHPHPGTVPPSAMTIDELMEQPAATTTTTATPAAIPRRGSLQVFIGGDVARLLGPGIVLRRRESSVDTAGLSPFEQFVLKHVDGTRTVAEVQTAMRLSEGDLRIVLALLLDKRLIEGSSLAPSNAVAAAPIFPPMPPPPAPAPAPAPAPPPAVIAEPPPAVENTPAPSSSLPPALGAPAAFGSAPSAFGAPAFGSAPAGSASMWGKTAGSPPPPSFTPAFAPAFGPKTMGLPGQGPPPGAPTSTSTPPPPQPRAAAHNPGAAALRAGLLIAGDHTKAAALHAACIRELKNGTVERAHQLARQALNAAPDMTLYRDTLAEWPAFVAGHRVADDIRFKAQAVTAEEAGDIDKAVALLRQSVAANPKNASSWNRLAVLLATKKADIDGAMEASQKAVELVPDDATFLSNFTKFAAIADKASGGIDKKARGMWNRLLGK
ncbi:MAG: hypothetical protein Q8O67_06030 [Deltaproteobacteria bacterium]|nr:hypothetical protein [Deltaproteobacteria bacterium]